MDNTIYELIRNTNVIALNQDRVGFQGKKVKNNNYLDVWKKPPSNNKVAVVLGNRSSSNAIVVISWTNISLDLGTKVDARDLWEHSTQSLVLGEIYPELDSNACKILLQSHKT
ncbi:alpha-galactosidase-like [Vicia villosa]|uniref:alpha-galactosidase-like n=1 Tax=Vicia villosa TaxID=3911 RepID=UPI00273C5081|nr:alpha-galactosidase-like [Vicia villosa]